MKKASEILESACELWKYYNSPGMNAEKLEQKIERLAKAAEKILESSNSVEIMHDTEEVRELAEKSEDCQNLSLFE